MRPNLFEFATSELSQDAFLCWLLSWADSAHEKSCPQLNVLAKDFLTLIYDRANVPLPAEFSTVKVIRQDGKIDISCVVNDETVILIKDKLGTKQHSDQLARYKLFISKKYGSDKIIIPVYIQTGDRSDYKEAADHGYIVFERHHLLRILECKNGKAAREKSDILDDFSDNLRRIENEVQSFLTLSPKQWLPNLNPWKGFYSAIQHKIQDGNWDYMSNPAGGFLGFWWHFKVTEEFQLYLQIEQEKFCFKIWVDDPEQRRYLREYWYHQVVSRCLAHGLKARRPNRFGNGEYMTVAILDQEYRVIGDNGFIDMSGTLKIIHSAQRVMDNCLAFFNGTNTIG